MLNWTRERLDTEEFDVLLEDTWRSDALGVGGLTEKELEKVRNARPILNTPRISLRYIEVALLSTPRISLQYTEVALPVKGTAVPRLGEVLENGHKARFKPGVVLSPQARWKFNEACYLASPLDTGTTARVSGLFFVSDPSSITLYEDVIISTFAHRESMLEQFESSVKSCFSRAVIRARNETVLPTEPHHARVATIARAFSVQDAARAALATQACTIVDVVSRERALTGDDGA